MTLIADSGSTKTAWCTLQAPGRPLYTQGINPYQQTAETIREILQHELLPQLMNQSYDASSLSLDAQRTIMAHCYFYGAGCTPEKAPIVAQVLTTIFPDAHIHVESDMLGAARALCGQQPGIVAILGTGSNSAYYDGRALHSGIPAMGYILGDEGSGAYIGKRLVGDVFKQQLPSELCQAFLDETGETQASIIQKVYRTPLPNRFLASLSPFCARHREHPAIHALLVNCFEQFFHRNIAPLMDKGTTVHFIGSIAHHYCAELTEAATSQGYSIGNIQQSPLQGLVTYHQQLT